MAASETRRLRLAEKPGQRFQDFVALRERIKELPSLDDEQKTKRGGPQKPKFQALPRSKADR